MAKKNNFIYQNSGNLWPKRCPVMTGPLSWSKVRCKDDITAIHAWQSGAYQSTSSKANEKYEEKMVALNSWGWEASKRRDYSLHVSPRT